MRYIHFNNVNTSNSWTWDIFPFICVFQFISSLSFRVSCSLLSFLKTATLKGVSHCYQHGHQRRAWNAKAAAAATKNPVCKHRSLSTPPLPGACTAHQCQDPVIQGQLPRENTQHTSGCYNVTPASAAAGSPCIPYPSLSQAWVSQSPIIGCYFNPVLSEQRTDALRWPTCLGRARSKAEPQELCEKQREREISPSSLRSSRSNLHNQHLWNTWIHNESSPNWGGGLQEQRYIYIFPFSLFVSVYVYDSLCDFACIALLLPFVLGFCLSILGFLFVCFLV